MNSDFPRALPRLCISALLLALAAANVNAQTPQHVHILAASNRTMSATLTITPGKPPLEIQDLRAKRTLALSQLFTITLADGSTLHSSDLHPDGNLAAISSPTEKQPCANSDDSTSGAHFRWCLLVPANSSYMRAQLTIHAGARELPIAQLHLLQFPDPHAHVIGTVRGSPAADDSLYFAFEHPLSVTTVDHGAVDAAITRILPLQANQEVTYSAVIGTYAPGQLRRYFLAYVERERPRRYKPFLNYNTWYDIGYENRYSEPGALDRIHAFGTELVEKRHVQLDSFVFDDGWDDPTSFWGFNHDLPDGFTRIAHQAATYNAGIGVWLSPWGGYAEQKRERIANGKALGYEIIANGFALSGPKYFHDFSAICSTMIQKFNVNAFKIDGTGNADRVFPGSVFDSDFDAAIHLIHQIRAEKPGIFMNLSTGTYPSPFWLFYSDTIWRGGDDHDFAGVGTQRQRWITYRDEQTYRNVVQAGPLFPLNSLMLHGMIFAQQAEDLSTDPHDDFPDEVLSFFGSCTQLQEMYVTPSLLA
ncbi:MAG: enterotoxin, partial [Acidobacteriaceae bacterium]